jgi:homoserine O-succinyltransferase
LADFNQCEREHGDPIGSIEALAAASADMVSSSQAQVGLLNLMPHCALEQTETQWNEAIGANVRLRFDDDPRLAGSRSAEYLAQARPFTEAASSLGALVITGANLELAHPDRPATSDLLPIDDIRFIRQLYDVIDASHELEIPVIYSCLASHIALEYLFELERDRKQSKVLGVYDHDVVQPDHPLTAGLGSTVKAPHSRWGGVSTKRLLDSDAEVIVNSEDAGWLLAVHGTSVYIQGHPEYWRDDLSSEYQRDKASGQQLPVNYYPDGDESGTPDYSWRADAQTLFANIRRFIAQQSSGL